MLHAFLSAGWIISDTPYTITVRKFDIELFRYTGVTTIRSYQTAPSVCDFANVTACIEMQGKWAVIC